MSRAKKTCPCCGQRNVGPIKTWKRITAYNDPESNLFRCCVHCIRWDDAYYAERWQDYYAGQGSHYSDKPPMRIGRRLAIFSKPRGLDARAYYSPHWYAPLFCVYSGSIDLLQSI